MNTRSIDIGQALLYMFEEEDWLRKGLIAVVLVLFSWLIIPGVILQGYTIEIIRRVGHGRRPYLPEWDDWGKFLSDGFIALVAFFLYSIPLFFLTCCVAIFLVAAADGGGELSGGATLVLCCAVLVILLLQVPIYLLYFAAQVRFAEQGGLASFFQFGQLWRLVQRHSGQYGFAVITIALANFAGGFVPFLGTAWAYLVTGHALGQLLAVVREGTLPPAMPGDDPFDSEPPRDDESPLDDVISTDTF